MSNSESSKNQNRDINYYSEIFSSLNVSRNKTKGQAYYKPILLLSVIDLITQGTIQDNKIFVSDELIDNFKKYWNVLSSDSSYKGGLHYPFFHLQSEGFWHLKFTDKFNGLQPKTTNKLKEAVEYASLDLELFELLQDNNSLQELIDTLIAVWFADYQQEIEDILRVNESLQENHNQQPQDDEFSDFEKKPKLVIRKALVRNSFFRKAVVHVYDYRCAICRLKVTRNLTQNIVDGAHIQPFAQFYNSHINNGLSLCKNHHWAFDRGWLSIDDNYRILVAEDLQEDSPNAKPLKEFHFENISLPNLEQYFPSIKALDWHRKNIFRP
ncbi:HNH endonuclease [Planktothricoides raciborskii]|uniref:HNH endonuclease n=1 Tax=Planktothricoides raciborskii GIHE-MW2 TaxID=2792601 RepID=A0AAU8JH56_9CYAN